ncbi:MAG TPA: hypothetical protein VF394_00935, partial [Candidatus Acidoferrum sp.]
GPRWQQACKQHHESAGGHAECAIAQRACDEWPSGQHAQHFRDDFPAARAVAEPAAFVRDELQPDISRRYGQQYLAARG